MQVYLNQPKSTAYQILINEQSFDMKQKHAKKTRKISRWYTQLHERSRNYVQPRPYIHYANRFSKSQR